MKCPRCRSHVETIRSTVDGRAINLCANAACDWEQLPTDQPDAEAEAREFRIATKGLNKDVEYGL